MHNIFYDEQEARINASYVQRISVMITLLNGSIVTGSFGAEVIEREINGKISYVIEYPSIERIKLLIKTKCFIEIKSGVHIKTDQIIMIEEK